MQQTEKQRSWKTWIKVQVVITSVASLYLISNTFSGMAKSSCAYNPGEPRRITASGRTRTDSFLDSWDGFAPQGAWECAAIFSAELDIRIVRWVARWHDGKHTYIHIALVYFKTFGLGNWLSNHDRQYSTAMDNCKSQSVSQCSVPGTYRQTTCWTLPMHSFHHLMCLDCWDQVYGLISTAMRYLDVLADGVDVAEPRP